MEPEPFLRAEVGQLVERIDGAGVDGARVAHHDRRKEPGAAVGGDRRAQQAHGDAEAVVRGQLAQVAGPDAEQVHGLSTQEWTWSEA